MTTPFHHTVRLARGAFALLALAALASASLGAEVVNYTWKGGNGNWADLNNWTPQPAKRPGTANDATSMDRVTIALPAEVTSGLQIIFSTPLKNPAAGKEGAFDAVSLSGGASLAVNNNMRVTSSPQYVRNVLIDRGSSLKVSGKNVIVGATEGSDSNTWVVRGSLTVVNFIVYKARGTDTGGFILRVDGGTVKAEGINWRFSRTAGNTTAGEVHLSNGGSADLGAMTGFDQSTGNYILFADASGKLTLSAADQAAVERLISSGFIRKANSVAGTLQVSPSGDAWQVTVAP